MNLGAVSIMAIVASGVTIMFAWALMRTYIDRRESNFFTALISTAAISVTLLCVMLIPVDIYIVSSGLNADGSQHDPDLTRRSGEAIQTVYYGLYIALLAMTFLLLPFTYFYYEEDSDNSTVRTRTCSALKYTAGFMVFFFVLLALGLVLKKSTSAQNEQVDWRQKLSNDFTNAEAVLSFCIGCLACIGLIGYVVYASYGLARLPLKLMARTKPRKLALPTSAVDTSARGANSNEDIELQLRRNQENLQYLQSQYDLSGRPWSKDDLRQMTALKKEARRLQILRAAKERGNVQRGGRGGDLEELTCWDKCWNFWGPFRMAIAIPLLLLSILLIVSISISVADKFKHSPCGPSCGYAMTRSHLLQPLDETFRAFAKAFPIDLIFFGALVLYIFLCAVSGIVGLGVRLCLYKLYSIQKQRTPPNAFLMAAWLLQLMTLVLNMQVNVIAPTYSTFGNQFSLNVTSGEHVSCDTTHIGGGTGGAMPHTCVQTQLAKFINTMAVETPFFSVILFYGNLAFLGLFGLFLAHGIFIAQNGKKEDVDAFRKLADESDSE